MASRSHSQKKPQQSVSPPVQNELRSRPFVSPAQPETSQPETPDLQTQLENAQRFGHSFSKIAASTAAIIQPKLTIGALGDQYEQEADRVAAQVVQRLNAPPPNPSSPARSQSAQSVQRETLPDEEELQMKPMADQIQRVGVPEEEELQMKSMVQRQAGGEAVTASANLESSIQQARSGGQPLADTIRQPMEQAFRADFSGVNVHTDTQSDQLNRSIQAKAFTTGQDIFFRQGAYEPGSRGGQELIAHELTHVVQQVAETTQRMEAKEIPIDKSVGNLPGYSEGSTVLQMKGVGGEKIGFKPANKEENKEAWAKLKRCWQAAKEKRKLEKKNIETGLEAKAGKGRFTEHYAEELDKIKDERNLLVEALASDITAPTVKIKENKIVVVTAGKAEGETETVIGEVITEPDTLYVKSAEVQETERETFKKQNPLEENSEKEYIKDTRGIYTRRYAYHEMNYHQMVDFIMSGELTGRYQMFMSAGEAANTSPQKIAHPQNKQAVSKREDVETQDLTWEEVAVLHQWKGSGPYQSGVSLTSTSREQVRSNKGELFKSKGGFRIKIDLAKVAAEVPIVNDYATGGVSQNASATTKTRPNNYIFPESATKNRELYIERVKKEWVVEVVHHGDSDVATTFPEIEKAGGGAEGVSANVNGIGIRAYLMGFEEGMKDENYAYGGKEGKLGSDAGRNVLAGYNRGKGARGTKAVATPTDALREQTNYEQAKVAPEHKYDAHKVGYMRGRCTTKAMFASLAEYGVAIKGLGTV